MSKKIIIVVVIIILLAIICGVMYFMSQNSNENNTQGQQNSADQAQVNENNQVDNQANNTPGTSTENNEENNEANSEIGRTLVVYFSAQGHTEEVAQKVANNLGADIFEIVPVNEYTSADLDWTDNDSRVTREHEDESLRNTELVSTTVDNWDSYDTVLIGYPIWWGIAAWPVDTFVRANDFTGKTVIPFCTSASSGLGSSGELLAEEAGTGNWLEGQRFRSNPSDSDINTWTDSLQ